MQPLEILRRSSFVKLLPAVAVTGCLLDFMVPAVRTALVLRERAGEAASVRIQFGQFAQIVPRNRFLFYGFERAAYSTQGLITVLNAPAAFPSALVSWLVAHGPRWTPAGLMPWQWIAITYPVYALPLWAFVGWGIDLWVQAKRMPTSVGWLSGLLSCASALLALGLRFGLTEGQWNGQDLLGSYITGFALWTFLLAIPFGAWIRCTWPTRESGQLS